MKKLSRTVAHALAWCAVCAWAVALTSTGALSVPLSSGKAPADSTGCAVPAAPEVTP